MNTSKNQNSGWKTKLSYYIDLPRFQTKEILLHCRIKGLSDHDLDYNTLRQNFTNYVLKKMKKKNLINKYRNHVIGSGFRIKYRKINENKK